MRKLCNLGEILVESYLPLTGMTQKELAKELNLSESVLSDILYGSKTLRRETATRLTKLFGMTISWWMSQ